MKRSNEFDLDRMMAMDERKKRQYEVKEQVLRDLAESGRNASDLTSAYLAGKLEGMADMLRMTQRSA